MVDSVQGAQSSRFVLRFTGVRPAAPTPAVQALQPRAARQLLQRLDRLQAALEQVQESPTRLPLRRTPSTGSAAALGLSYGSTFARLRSSEEVNATQTSFAPSDPAFGGGSSAAPSVGGVYDGSQGDDTLTFTALDSAAVGSDDPLRIEVRDGLDQVIDTLDFTSVAADTPVALANGLTLALGAGDVVASDSFQVTVSTAGSAVVPDNPFDGAGSGGPNFEAGQGVTDGAFDVNGVSIDVFASDTLLDVLARISDSAAGVTASFDAPSEEVRLVQKTAGASHGIVLANDTSGFLAATKLAAAVTTAGRDPDPDEPLADVPALAAIAGGSFTVNGTTLMVDPSSDSLQDVLDRINDAGIGAVAELNTRTDRVSIRAHARSSLTLGNGTSGLFTALGISPGSYEAVPEGSSAFAKPVRVQAQLEALAGELNDLLASGLGALGSDLEASARSELGGVLRESFARAASDTSDSVLRSGFGLTLDAASSDAPTLHFERSAFRRAASRNFDGLLDFLLEEPSDGPSGFLPTLQRGLDALRSEITQALASDGTPGALVDASV